MDFDSLKDLNSGLGTGAVIVMDKSTDIIAAIARFSKFYAHESCGQCTPCREGTTWLMKLMDRMVGHAFLFETSTFGLMLGPPHRLKDVRQSARSTCCMSSASRSKAVSMADPSTCEDGKLTCICSDTICALGDAAAWPVQGLLQKFRPEVVKRIRDFNEKNGTVLFGGRMASERKHLPSPSWPENTIPSTSTLTL